LDYLKLVFGIYLEIEIWNFEPCLIPQQNQKLYLKISIWPLMITVSTARALLRPFPFIIFTPNFLSDHWISHIKKPEDKATQMGEMRNTPSCSFHGREEFDEAENDDKVFSGNGEKEVDVDEPIWKEPTVGEKYSIDGSGSSNHRDAMIEIGSKQNGTDTGTDSAE
jgi:hypothetical protein